jgi:sugar O-acyltransferase (sialic acid O-acetyltransferase NeuD family)
MNEYRVQKEGVSDTSYTLTKKMFRNFDFVNFGDNVCCYESSKADIEIVSKNKGFILFLHEVGDDLMVGDLIFIISDDKDKLLEFESSLTQNSITGLSKITKKAMILMEKNGLKPEMFDKEIINEEVILEFLRVQESLKGISQFQENDLVIIGGGGHSKQCYEILLQNLNFKIVGFLDDNVNTKLFDLPYLGSINILETLKNKDLKNVILGIGFNGQLKKRDKLFNSIINLGFNIPSIIHNDSSISKFSKISDRGVQLMANCTIGPGAVIEDNVIINTGAIVSHDCKISVSSHITPGSILGGNVTIGKRCTIGLGSNLYLGVSISDDKTIKNGECIYESK